LIGEGAGGYTHYGKEGSDVIQCADGSEWKEGDVAKLGRGLTGEFERAENIRKHYPTISEFAVLPTRVCAADKAKYEAYVDSQPESDTKLTLSYADGEPEILFAPYGGATLKDVVRDKTGAYNRQKILAAMEILRDQIAEMNKHRVYHYDIKMPNIVYKDGKLYLIDFGTSHVFADDEELPEESPDLEEMNSLIEWMKTWAKKGGARRKSFQAKRT
jgi:hypothetical protein